MSKRIKNKSKQADETLVDLVEVTGQAQGFIEKNQMLIFGALIGLVVIIGGVFAYNNFYVAPQQQEAVEQMTQAQVQFERDSFALALTNPGGGYSGFLDIIDNYGATRAGNLASYYAGICYLHLGEYDAAIDYLKDFSATGEVTPAMKYGAIGDAYSEKEDFDSAMDYYERAAKANDNEIITAYYLKKIGLLHERNGAFKEAKEAYEKIKKEYPNSPDGRDIQKYIGRVESQG